ncbi:MAG: glycosyltransferase family 4 protein [Conexivisphaerales archaeon]
MSDELIRCMVLADYDEVSGRLRRAAHLRLSHPPEGVKYQLVRGKNYPSRVSHYKVDPLSIFLVGLRFLAEGSMLGDAGEADIQHIFFWKRGRKGIPAIFENDQSLSQFLSTYVGVNNEMRERIRRLFLPLTNLKSLKAIVVWSQWGKRGFERDGFSGDLIRVIPPPLDIPRVTARSESRRILFIGRDYRRKGGDIALKAFISLAKEFETVELNYVGHVDDEILLRRAKQTGRFFHYENPADDVLYGKIIPESGIFLLPSRSEAFGISIVEAMSFSLPVVVSDLPSIRENVIDGYNGFLVNEEERSYEEALRILLQDEKKKRKLGENAREFVKNKFSPSKVGSELKKVYLNSLG